MIEVAGRQVLLRALFDAAVGAADPFRAVAGRLPPAPRGRTVVIGAGKAAIQMASALEANWKGKLEGFVVAPHGYQTHLSRIETVFGGHPVPDEGSAAAARKALELAQGLGPDDLLIALISGGGSALMCMPAPGIELKDKLAVTTALLKSGANIAELNCVRKQLSAIKGGRLAAAAGDARIFTLVISDVPGDDPAIVASGPTVPDSTTRQDARAIVERYRIALPASVAAFLDRPDRSRGAGRANALNEVHVIVSPAQSFAAASRLAEERGFHVLYLGDRIEGEAREVAKVHAAIALQIRQHDSPARKPCLLLSGGETGVTVRGRGRGGRNVEFLLSLAVSLAGEPGIHALAADTDGIDGMEEIAGAMIAPDTLERARAAGLDPVAHLENNDAHGFFEALDDQVITGPTQTNVNDFRAILIE